MKVGCVRAIFEEVTIQVQRFHLKRVRARFDLTFKILNLIRPILARFVSRVNSMTDL